MIKDVLMSISSKANSLYRHDLMTLTQQKSSTHRSFLPERFEKLVKKYPTIFETNKVFLIIKSENYKNIENPFIKTSKTV